MVDGLAVTALTSGLSSHLSMKEIIPLCLVQQTHKISPRVGLLNKIPRGGGPGVWEGMGWIKKICVLLYLQLPVNMDMHNQHFHKILVFHITDHLKY